MVTRSHLKIKALKYNYQASGIVKALKKENFTIYREKAMLHGYTNLVVYKVSVPDRFFDLAGVSQFHRIVRNEIGDLIRTRDKLKIEGPDFAGSWGWARIMTLENIDQIAVIYQKL